MLSYRSLILKITVITCAFHQNAFALTLNEALASSYQTSPQMQSAIQSLKAVDEEMPAAISGMLPTASISAQNGRRDLSQGGLSANGSSDTQSIQVTQPLFKGGQTYASIKKANKDILAARERFKITEQQVLLASVASYMNLVRDIEVLDLAKNNKKVLEQHLESTQVRFDLGEVTRTDVAEAKAALAKADSEVISAQRAYETSRANYKNNIGVDAENVKIPENAIKINGDINELISTALANNPEVKAAMYDVDSAKSDINIKKSTILPQVSAFANKSREDGMQLSGGNLKTDSSMVGLNFSIPLYQGGIEYANVRIAKHVAGKFEYDLAGVQNNVRESVVTAYQDFKVAQALIKSNEANVEAEKVALEGTKQESYAGLRTNIDVLDAQQALFDAQSNLISAHRDEIVSSYALVAQLGQLTARDLGLKVDVYEPEKNANKAKYHLIGF